MLFVLLILVEVRSKMEKKNSAVELSGTNSKYYADLEGNDESSFYQSCDDGDSNSSDNNDVVASSGSTSGAEGRNVLTASEPESSSTKELGEGLASSGSTSGAESSDVLTESECDSVVKESSETEGSFSNELEECFASSVSVSAAGSNKKAKGISHVIKGSTVGLLLGVLGLMVFIECVYYSHTNLFNTLFKTRLSFTLSVMSGLLVGCIVVGGLVGYFSNRCSNTDLQVSSSENVSLLENQEVSSCLIC